jgi:hypothetical protein
MNFKSNIFFFSCFIMLAQSSHVIGMFPGKSMPRLSRQDLETRKDAMRQELDALSLSAKQDTSTANLLRVKNLATAVATTTSQTDPQMARRAKTLIWGIEGKLRNRMDVTQ